MADREREREGIAKNVSRFALVFPPSDIQCATCTKTLAKNYRRLGCNSCLILHHNKCGQVKPRKFKRQFQSIITTWICPRCVTKSLLAELPMAGIGNTSCESLLLDEGEVKGRMYGKDFWFKSIIRTGCLGITRLRRDCCRLPGLNSLITHNFSSRGCVFFPSIRANCVRFVRYDRNQPRAEPQIANLESSLLSRMSWSIWPWFVINDRICNINRFCNKNQRDM